MTNSQMHVGTKTRQLSMMTNKEVYFFLSYKHLKLAGQILAEIAKSNP